MTDDYISRTLQAYNDSPEKYVESTAEMVLFPELETLISLLPTKDKPILDAGCAYGRDMEVISSSHGIKVVGIDMSDELLNRGKQLHPQFDFHNMDVRHLDFENETFSGVWCNAVLLHLNDEDIKQALDEFVRVLVAGGAICISFKEGEGSEQLVEKFSSNGARFYNYKTQVATEQMLRQAGFEIKESYILNERERFGADKRDLNWVYCFGVKAEKI
jgi:ubiquinone/menaquinone biosynthesis C-methylase UbiE